MNRSPDGSGKLAEMIVTSKLLVLQSKRILLTGAQGKLDRYGREQTRVDVARLESEVRYAHERYNDAVLHWASPQTPQYQLVAYTSLISKGERLLASLRRALNELPLHDRDETMSEIKNLEKIVDGWRSLARASMAAAVA